MKNEFLRILIKIEEMNEKLQKNQGDILPKILISQMLRAL